MKTLKHSVYVKMEGTFVRVASFRNWTAAQGMARKVTGRLGQHNIEMRSIWNNH